VRLQEGETEGYLWLSEEKFIDFIASEMIDTHKKSYEPYFRKMNYID